MKNRKFKDLSNDRIVKVTDQFEDIIILDGKNKIKVNQLLDKRLFEEYVDPSSFFNNESLINSFAEQIKKIPLDDWNNRIPAEDMGYDNKDLYPNMNESAVLPYDPEIEKQELLKKAQTVYNMGTTNELIQKQREALRDILEEDEEMNQVVQNPPINNSVTQQQPNQIIQQIINEDRKMDPILEMFKNVKRNTSFKIEFTVENKIPRVDFIEMMEDSYNTSIIEFLAQEFTDDILKDPSIIKERIKKKLMDLVYPEVENIKRNHD
jgi:hypothetical protein